MRHRVKKIKFRGGKDANKMLIRKLIKNFITKGKLQTTLAKAKALKSEVERFVEKSKQESEANKKYLLRILKDSKLVKTVFTQIGTPLKSKTGGYVRVVKLGRRDSDGSEIARLEWVYPVVIENQIKHKKTKNKLIKTKTPEKVMPAKQI